LFLALEGRIKHPQRFDVEALRKLPAEPGFRSKLRADDGSEPLLSGCGRCSVAGGIDDAEKGCGIAAHHQDRGPLCMVVISTGDCPEFGGKPAPLAYRQDGTGGRTGLRPVAARRQAADAMRDVVSITIE
jgi:hypothetical protein